MLLCTLKAMSNVQAKGKGASEQATVFCHREKCCENVPIGSVFKEQISLMRMLIRVQLTILPVGSICLSYLL